MPFSLAGGREQPWGMAPALPLCPAALAPFCVFPRARLWLAAVLVTVSVFLGGCQGPSSAVWKW